MSHKCGSFLFVRRDVPPFYDLTDGSSRAHFMGVCKILKVFP